jgi:hypothetical protein
MRRPSILDVLRAVRDVSRTHPAVRAWWYAPGHALRLQGTLAVGEAGGALEVVVEIDDGDADLARIGGELSDRLGHGRISVRRHLGNAEERQLYRLLSGGKTAPAAEPLPAGAGARDGA